MSFFQILVISMFVCSIQTNTSLKASSIEHSPAGSTTRVSASIESLDLEEILKHTRNLDAQSPVDEASKNLRSKWLAAGYFNIYILAKHSDEISSDLAIKKDEFYQKVLDHSHRSIDSDPNDSNAHAMLTVIYGLKISENPLSAIKNGRKLLNHRNSALQKIDSNPRVSLLEAISQIHRSNTHEKQTGALELLLKSEQLFDQELKKKASNDDSVFSWGYTMNQIFLAETYEKIGNNLLALKYFNKSKELSPNLIRAIDGVDRCKAKLIRR